MPNAAIKNLAKKSGKSTEEVERLWNKAKDIAQKKVGTSDSSKFYAFTMGILKKMLKQEGLTVDPEVLVDQYLEGDMETNGTPHKVRAEPRNSSSKIFKRDQFRRRREDRDKERRQRQNKKKADHEQKD